MAVEPTIDPRPTRDRSLEPSRSTSPFISDPGGSVAKYQACIQQENLSGSLEAVASAGPGALELRHRGLSESTASLALDRSSGAPVPPATTHDSASLVSGSRSQPGERPMTGSWRGALRENGSIGLGNHSLVQCVDIFFSHLTLSR